MNTCPPAFDDEGVLDGIADALADTGYCLLHDALPDELSATLYQRIAHLRSDQFYRAGVGREQDLQLNSEVRRDRIHWLEGDDPSETAYLGWMERLRCGLNRRLFMGLFDYEGHFAHYPPGAFYARHLDAFRGHTNRILSTVFYLNPNWSAAQGGELLLYPEQGDAVLERVLPRAGTLAIFLSDRFPHEVLPAASDRYSIAGWFRVNGSNAQQVDPPR